MAQVRKDNPICLMQLVQLIRDGRAFDLAKAGRSTAATKTMQAMVMRSSIRANASADLVGGDSLPAGHSARVAVVTGLASMRL